MRFEHYLTPVVGAAMLTEQSTWPRQQDEDERPVADEITQRRLPITHYHHFDGGQQQANHQAPR